MNFKYTYVYVYIIYMHFKEYISFHGIRICFTEQTHISWNIHFSSTTDLQTFLLW